MDLRERILSLNPSNLAIAFDGSRRAYPLKNLLESHLASAGVNILDLGTATASMLSSSMKFLDVDFGVLIYSDSENRAKIFDSKGKEIILSGAKEFKSKNWSEVGRIESFDLSRIYYKNLKNFLKFGFKKANHIVLNLSFSPASKVAPYLLRNFALKLTTLNATDEEIFDSSWEENVELTKKATNSYDADLSLMIDKNAEKLEVFNKKGSVNVLEEACKFLIQIDNDIDRIIVKNGEIKIKGIDILKEGDLDEKTILVDLNRKTLIYPKFSWCFDAILTFILWYQYKFMEK